MLHSLYYAVLMLLLPLLRRYISARACAMLWLVPNYLYRTQQSYMKVPEPLVVVRVSGNWVWTLFGIWLTGFASVLLWKIVSHLRFRKLVSCIIILKSEKNGHNSGLWIVLSVKGGREA